MVVTVKVDLALEVLIEIHRNIVLDALHVDVSTELEPGLTAEFRKSTHVKHILNGHDHIWLGLGSLSGNTE